MGRWLIRLGIAWAIDAHKRRAQRNRALADTLALAWTTWAYANAPVPWSDTGAPPIAYADGELERIYQAWHRGRTQPGSAVPSKA